MSIEFQSDQQLGDTLNNYSKLQTLVDETEEGLAGQIRQIKFPIDIISIVTKGNRFYCFFNASRVLKKKIK